ncbi:PKD domain-containing protein, partial [Metallibacterium scheffleri]|uniref:PKD domain-containing protein n=1 Tax=Metallibacterium scheffleri TaxID=993689 RepID=UPI0023F05E1E
LLELGEFLLRLGHDRLGHASLIDLAAKLFEFAGRILTLAQFLPNSIQSSTLSETVNSDPVVSIASSQNPTDVGNSVTFTASASQGTGSFSFTWYVNGATQSSTTDSLDLSFSTAGSYYVNVTIKDSVGDSASYSFKETVNPDPSVSITTSQNPTDIGNSVTFTASGNGGTGSYSYQWYVGGNAISGATSSTYTTSFTSSGTDTIYVIIKDPWCWIVPCPFSATASSRCSGASSTR